MISEGGTLREHSKGIKPDPEVPCLRTLVERIRLNGIIYQ